MMHGLDSLPMVKDIQGLKDGTDGAGKRELEQTTTNRRSTSELRMFV